MREKVKLIIEVDKKYYEACKDAVKESYPSQIEEVIANGAPYNPKGKWINHRNDYGHNIADCSLCGKTMQWHDEDGDGVPRYCWYCGAAMKGVKDEST